MSSLLEDALPGCESHYTPSLSFPLRDDNVPKRETWESSPSNLQSSEHLKHISSLGLTKYLGQIVCESCRELVSFPPGAKCVQYSCCEKIHFVLEAHQGSFVKYVNCFVLLIYQFGTPSVRYSDCNLCDYNWREQCSITGFGVAKTNSSAFGNIFPGYSCKHLGKQLHAVKQIIHKGKLARIASKSQA